jgi:hypothetical protein
MRKYLFIIYSSFVVNHVFSQDLSKDYRIVYGKWELVKYIESYDGKKVTRKIDNAEMKAYDFKPDSTFTLITNDSEIVGKWKLLNKTNLLLYNIVNHTKKGDTYNAGERKVQLIKTKKYYSIYIYNYDKGLNETHELYYEKIK